MKQCLLTIVTIFIAAAVLQPQLYAEEKTSSKQKWALGLVYPGTSIRYKTNGKSAWELKAQSGSEIFVLGPRYYRYFNVATNPVLFWGVEADYISFKGDESKGSGFAGGAFVGGEFSITKDISMAMDFGPMYINLKDSEFTESVSGMDFILNLGIYYSF